MALVGENKDDVTNMLCQDEMYKAFDEEGGPSTGRAPIQAVHATNSRAVQMKWVPEIKQIIRDKWPLHAEVLEANNPECFVPSKST